MATVQSPEESRKESTKDSAQDSSVHGKSGRRIPHVIAVTSGKGGVGKTSLSVNLAVALCRMGRKVCILDADTGFANVNILLGLTPEFNLEHVLYADKSVADVLLKGPHGLQIIPGANRMVDGVDLEPRQQLNLCRELAAIESGFDYLLIDTAAGFNETAMSFIRAAQQTLIVLTPEPTSLTDGFSLVRMLHRRGRRRNLHVVVNMCKSARQAREVYYRFAAAVEKYIGVQLRYLGCVLRDESLQAAVSMQSPVALFERSDPSSQRFFRLAEVLDDSLSAESPRAGFSAYWHALYRRRRGDPAQDSRATEVVRAADKVAPSSPSETIGQDMAEGAAGLPAPEARRRDLSNLQTRLLTLMAERSVPAGDFQQLIDTLAEAFRNHYPDARGQQEKAIPDVSESSVPQSSRSPGQSTPDRARGAFGQHGFDQQKFGKQGRLLQQIRSDQDTPLIELLERWQESE